MKHITIDELAVELSKVGKVDDGEVVKAQREIISKPTNKVAHIANWFANLTLYFADVRESVMYGNGYRELSLKCGDAKVYFDKYHDHSIQVVRIDKDM